MKTRITELFGVQHPVMMAGMNWISEPKLVAAVSNAGGLGILATARCTPKETTAFIREIKNLTDKPFGINQALHIPSARENIAAAIAEKVPVINYSLGKPWFVEDAHSYGGKVVGTIAIARHAVRAEALGCDALVVTGYEAAAHGGEATSMVLIPTVARQVKIPLIAAGGFYGGQGLAAALVLGADAISMGTRLMITKESRVHPRFKELCIAATEQDTLYDDHFDGMPGRVLKTPATLALMKAGFPIFRAISAALEVKRILGMSWPAFIGSSFGMMRSEQQQNLLTQARFVAGNSRLKAAALEGDEKEGFIFAGQSCAGILDLPSCQEVVERTIAEAETLLKTASRFL